MKLFSKYNRITVIFTVAIFIAGSIVSILLIRYVVNNQTDQDLTTEKNEIVTYVEQFGSLPDIENIRGEYTIYKPVHQMIESKPRFYTQKRWNKEEHDSEPVRSIEWNLQVGNKFYLVIVSKSMDVTEDLVQSIIIITIVLILLILIAGLLANRILLKKLWQPFYQSMGIVQQFKLNDSNQLRLNITNIDEFNLMNITLQNALNKAQHDYYALKEFTENASHELQTPLAVISAKLDIIIQSDELTELQSEAAGSAYEAIKTLKKLNRSLLLLAKIENRQFVDIENIRLAPLLEEKQKQFAEQLQSKEIEVRTDLKPVSLFTNQQLIDILLNNLFGNTIRHNIMGGNIAMQLYQNQFTISNSGKPKPLEEQYIFSRFYKGNSADVHHGLGLSIVKQICDVSGYTCHYRFTYPNLHSFVISW